MKQMLGHCAGHSAGSCRVTHHKYASIAQTFTVYAPSEVSFCFVYCVNHPDNFFYECGNLTFKDQR